MNLFFSTSAFCVQVLDFHWHDYQNLGEHWGKVYMAEPNNGWNQAWEIRGREIICKGFQSEKKTDLRLDVYHSCTASLSKVGVHPRNGTGAQIFDVKMAAEREMMQLMMQKQQEREQM